MYRAKIEFGWSTDIYEGETAHEIVDGIADRQNLRCLLGMAESMEPDETQFRKLESFILGYYDCSLSIEDIRNLDIQLSFGNIKCLELKEI